MIAILVGVSLAGAITVIWYGRRAAMRIQQWGVKMNEVDAIFRSVATAEEMAAYTSPAQKDGAAASAAQTRVAVGLPR